MEAIKPIAEVEINMERPPAIPCRGLALSLTFKPTLRQDFLSLGFSLGEEVPIM